MIPNKWIIDRLTNATKCITKLSLFGILCIYTYWERNNSFWNGVYKILPTFTYITCLKTNSNRRSLAEQLQWHDYYRKKKKLFRYTLSCVFNCPTSVKFFVTRSESNSGVCRKTGTLLRKQFAFKTFKFRECSSYAPYSVDTDSVHFEHLRIFSKIITYSESALNSE